MREGESGRALFLVMSGECEVLQRDEHGAERRLAILRAGDCFGEMALLTGDPSSATVRATDDARLLAITQQDFPKLTEAMPDTGTLVMQENNERQEALGFLMENLRPRERKVLDLRFGLTGNGTHSLRQIGHLLRISKERVRQIQNRALEKLRSSAERVGWEPTLRRSRQARPAVVASLSRGCAGTRPLLIELDRRWSSPAPASD